MEISTTPKTESSYQGEDWLMDLENPSESDVRWLEESARRDKQVGELLRELHYFVTSNQPLDVKAYPSEEAYWLAEARNAPGYRVTALQENLARLKSEKLASSTAESQTQA